MYPYAQDFFPRKARLNSVTYSLVYLSMEKEVLLPQCVWPEWGMSCEAGSPGR